MVTIEGPRFSSKAESKMFRAWGADVINMTTVPEVKIFKCLNQNKMKQQQFLKHLYKLFKSTESLFLVSFELYFQILVCSFKGSYSFQIPLNLSSRQYLSKGSLIAWRMRTFALSESRISCAQQFVLFLMWSVFWCQGSGNFLKDLLMWVMVSSPPVQLVLVHLVQFFVQKPRLFWPRKPESATRRWLW